MKKKIFRAFVSVLFTALLFAAFTLAISAEKTFVAEGYCVSGKDGSDKPVNSNVKWTVYNEDGVGVIYFDIDNSKGSDNTVLHARKKDGNSLEFWTRDHYTASPWGEYTVNGSPEVKKAVVGEGITAINGPAFCGSKIETIELPKTVVSLANDALANATKLTTVNITGDAANPEVINLKYITAFTGQAFNSLSSAKKYILNPDYSGEIKGEAFKSNLKLTELEIPAGVTKLGNKVFNNTNKIQKLIFKGRDIEFTSNTFGGLTRYPRIVGYVGSAVDTYAKANGFTFINIETNETVYEGTKPLVPLPSSGDEQNPPSDPDDENEFDIPTELTKFDPAGSTAHGHMTSTWDGSTIVDTYWAYYDSTKTLKLFSNTTDYNESGCIDHCDDKIGWKEYADVIEHVVVGPFIKKLSNKAFDGMSSLIDVQLSPMVTSMGERIFGYGEMKATTVWVEGRTRVEGLADFSLMKMTADSVSNTKIVKLKLSAKNEDPAAIKYPSTLETIITPNFNDTFDQFCKENLYDLQDAYNPANVKAYCIRLDPSWTVCGPRSGFTFDKSTGTLTIHGVGNTKDIINYFGGGSKNQPWFSIKNDIKHIVVTEHITGLGKYAFAECKNLETVQLPAKNGFNIGAAAFQKCSKLKSVFVEGGKSIEGTLDLSTVSGDIGAYTFASDYLIANVIVGEGIKSIKNYAFEGNIELNLKNIYGKPGTIAEKYAKDNALNFLDIASNTPAPVTCTPPPEPEETTGGEDTGVSSPETGDNSGETASPITPGGETTGPEFNIHYVGDELPAEEPEGPNVVLIVVIIVVAVAALAAGGTVAFMVVKKKTGKNPFSIILDKLKKK